MEVMENISDRGISQANIDKLMVDIIDYAERSNKILNNIQMLVNDTSNYYICESGTLYRRKFNEFFKESSTVNKNILSYKEDLMNVKSKYVALEDEVAQRLRNAAKSHEVKDLYKEEK